MDDPVKQIEGVVRALTQGSPNEQAAAVNRYFTRNAEFVHPFCRVPPFEHVSVPFIGETNSRQLLLAVLKWYRILSPRIDLKINSVQFDEARNTLYVDIDQRFALWFVPFYAANVNLVTRLHLTKTGGSQYQDSSQARLLTQGDKPTHGYKLPKPIQNGAELPSFAQVISSDKPLVSHRPDTSVTFGVATINGTGGDDEAEGKYLIAKQDDLYQTNEFIKFLVPFGIGDFFTTLIQLFAAAFSLAGTIAFYPLVWILTDGGARGNVMPPSKSVGDDGQVKWKGEGAEWARRTFSPLNSISMSAVHGLVVNLQENAERLGSKASQLAQDAQQRGRKLIHNVAEKEDAFVRNVQQRAEGLADHVQQGVQNLAENAQQTGAQYVDAAGGLVSNVQQGAQNFAENAQQMGAQYVDAAQQKGAGYLDAAQKKEEGFVRNAQAKEEEVVRKAQGKEEQVARKAQKQVGGGR